MHGTIDRNEVAVAFVQLAMNFFDGQRRSATTQNFEDCLPRPGHLPEPAPQAGGQFGQFRFCVASFHNEARGKGFKNRPVTSEPANMAMEVRTMTGPGGTSI